MRLLKSIAILLLPLKAMACGLDWSEPVSHFENVDFQGNIHIVRKLGEVEKLPIYLIFNSSYGTSPYAGSGFEIPFLESRMWQVDENRFRMKSPDGWLWIFQRTKVPNVLDGNAGWKGLIKDDTITVWAPCGDKIAFKNGKIVSMQLKNEKFDYAYKGNRVESIQMNGRPILEIKSDDKTGDVTGINLPITRKLIGLQQTGSRPKIESVRGICVVNRVDKTLSEVTKPDGSKDSYVFGVDSQMQPTLKLDGNEEIVWNSVTKKVIRDGEWIYRVTPSIDNFANAFIGRTNAQKQSENWFYDSAHGRQTVQETDGTTKTETWFVSGGVLNGKKRAAEIFRDNHIIKQISYSYDEAGNLIRERRNDLLLTYNNGTLTQVKKKKATLWDISK
jgi:hypothetical protein